MNFFTLKNAFYGLLIVVAAIFAVKGLQYLDKLKSDRDRLFTELVGQKESYQQLSANAAKLEIDYKKQSDIRADAEKRFSNEKGALLDKIKILSDATFLIKEKARQSGSSDVTWNGVNSQYVMNEIRFGNDGPPVGYVLIFKDGRVVSKIYNHQIKIDTVVSKSEDSGRYSIISKADFILKSPSLNPNGKVWTNQPYPLNIVSGTAEIDPTEPILTKRHLQLWVPKLNVNLNFDPNGVYPGAGVSIAGYGRSADDLDYKFLQLGFQVVNHEIQPTVIPIYWRPFDGFIDNTYLGPGVSYGNGQVRYFLGIGVGL